MIVCLGFHQGDADLARRLLQWITRLGASRTHQCLLVADAGCPWQEALSVHQEASIAFPNNVVIIDNVESVKGWPKGPNSLWLVAAKHCYRKKLSPWLWLEPDAIPLKPNWLDALESDYAKRNKPYLGAIIENPIKQPGLPTRYLNGVAMYPASAYADMGEFAHGDKAFDIASSDKIVPLADNTPLIQCWWGEPNLPPIFVPSIGHGAPLPRNAFTLKALGPESVLFHRNQDLSLIKLLWERDYPASAPGEPFVVVLPFHNGDAPMQIKNVQWMAKLMNGELKRYNCVLSFEKGTISPFQDQMIKGALDVFKTHLICNYPKAPNARWPAGANWAFKHTAGFMQNVQKAWLWLESDFIPVVPKWLDVLQSEYAHCRKPVMGSIVRPLGHVNGTAVYPPNLLKICPELMSIPDTGAFDTFSKTKILPITHEANHLMAHVWGIEKGMPHSFIGQPARFLNRSQVEAWVPKGCVTFHRCKDGSLIDRLTEIYGLR